MSSTSSQTRELNDVVMYSTQFCPYCVAAKQLLHSKGIEYREIDVSYDPEEREKMQERSQRRTVPQIFAGDMHIGGYTDLVAYFGE